MSELKQLRGEADAVLEAVARLDPRALLFVHREVCRRAAAIYEPVYRAKRDANWRAAKREHEDGHR